MACITERRAKCLFPCFCEGWWSGCPICEMGYAASETWAVNCRAQEQRNLDRFAQKELMQCMRRLTDGNITHTDPSIVAGRWSKLLYQAVDGNGLKESAKVSHQHQWIADCSKMLTGRDFVNCNRVRIGALPTKSRTSRGRLRDRRCRAGCPAQETLNHVLQHCHRIMRRG